MQPNARFEGTRLLHKFIVSHDLSQADAAKALNVSSVAIHAWVNGRNRPRPQYREAIAVWTSGAVPATSWERASERRALSAVKPWAPVTAKKAG